MRKSLFSISAAVLSGLMLSLLSSCGPDNSSDTNDGYDISFDGNGSVKAKVEDKSNGKKKLVISGSGKIKDFADASGRPYAKEAKNIDEVSISDQVTYIGRNSFKDFAITSIVLPKSVTEIGYTIVSDGVDICSLGETTVSQPATSKATIYYYKEKAPSVDYRYYLKGSTNHAPEDITAGVAEDSNKYWHYVNEDVAIYNKKKVLFIGNSFTFRNGTDVNEVGGIPRIFTEIGRSLNEYVETWAVMGSALTLASHADSSTETGKQVDILLTKYSDWDYVVLQEQSTKPLTDFDGFNASAVAIANKVKANNPNAKMVLSETWGYPKVADSYNGIQNMERSLRRAYNRAAANINAEVLKVGSAFTYIVNDSEHDVTLWNTDNMHQSYYGAYLSASVAVGGLLGADVRNATYVNDAELDPKDQIDAETFKYLKEVAYNCVFDANFNPDTDITIEHKPLHIAMYQKYITEENFKTLLTAYKINAEDRNIGCNNITYTVYVGYNADDPYYTVANLSAAIMAEKNEDGTLKTDIIFPCGNNINSSGNMDNTIVTNERKSAYGDITVFGESGRYIARTNDNDMTMDFFNWMISDEAKKIMDSSYDPTPTPEPTVSHDLEVAVWGRFISEENFLVLWNDFKVKNATEIGGKDVHYTYYEGASSGEGNYSVATFVSNVKKNGTYNVVFPAGSNIDDSDKLPNAVEKIEMGCLVFGKESRYVAYYDSNALTLAFKNYITSDAAKALMDDTYVPAAGPDLKIAVWGRYITEENFKTLLTAFEATSAASDKEIVYSYIGSSDSADANYGVDAYVASSKAYEADVLFPAGNNIDTKYGDGLIGKEAIGVNVFGQTSRYVAWTNEDDMTIAFKNWILTDEAKQIMDDTYVPTTPVDYSLNIIVWGRFISEDNFKLVLDGFKTYCAAQETPLDTSNVTYVYEATASRVADFAAVVCAEGSNYDVVFPSGSNFASNLSEGYSAVHHEALPANVFGETSRYVTTLTSKAMSEAFYSYIFTSEAQAIYNSAA